MGRRSRFVWDPGHERAGVGSAKGSTQDFRSLNRMRLPEGSRNAHSRGP